MKPQTMLAGEFFSELCNVLGLDFHEEDEHSVVAAVKALANTPAQQPAAEAAPASGEGGAIVNRSSYDNDDVDDMIGALLDIADTLGKHNVSARQIAQGVHALQTELSAAKARIQAVEAALKPFAFCPIHPSWDDKQYCEIWMRDNSGGKISVNEGIKLGDVRRAVNALQAARAADAGNGGGA